MEDVYALLGNTVGFAATLTLQVIPWRPPPTTPPPIAAGGTSDKTSLPIRKSSSTTPAPATTAWPKISMEARDLPWKGGCVTLGFTSLPGFYAMRQQLLARGVDVHNL